MYRLMILNDLNIKGRLYHYIKNYKKITYKTKIYRNQRNTHQKQIKGTSGRKFEWDFFSESCNTMLFKYITK